ncbi:MAG: hypothetical protein Q9178_001635 [Gyalolechia marmorata]
MQWTIFVYLVHLITWQTHQAHADGNIPRAIDSSTSGNYTINHCQRVFRSTDVHQLLAQTRETIRLVLSDLKLGIASPHGFRTFFKSNTNLQTVNQVFRAIAQGENLSIGKPPKLECAAPEYYTGPELETYRTLCTPPGRTPSHATSIPPYGVIVLCPEFWEASDFPGEEACLNVVGRRGRRKFADSGAELRNTKLAILLHELVHLYNPLDGASTRAEVYDARECVALDKEASVANAENWALYAASVRAKCTKFPLLPVGGDLKI